MPNEKVIVTAIALFGIGFLAGYTYSYHHLAKPREAGLKHLQENCLAYYPHVVRQIESLMPKSDFATISFDMVKTSGVWTQRR